MELQSEQECTRLAKGCGARLGEGAHASVNNVLLMYAEDLVAGAMLSASWVRKGEGGGKITLGVEHLLAAKKNKCM